MSRHLPDWITAFRAYTDVIESPPRFRLWAAIGAVAAALERRTWSRLIGRPIYANQYVVLVAEAGIGKSNAINEARRFIIKAGLNVPPDTITKEKLFVVMEEKYRRIKTNGANIHIDTPLTIISDELGVTLQKDDLSYMNILTKFWDSPDTYDYDTKSGGHVHVENVSLSMLLGTTPRWLAEVLPLTAYEMGFASRLVIVYENTPLRLPISRREMDPELYSALTNDLKEICKLEGEFQWSNLAMSMLNEWYEGGLEPKPTEDIFKNYNTRRLSHVIKLSMVVSASKRSDLKVTEEDFEVARRYLLDAEATAPRALEAVSVNTYSGATIQAMRYVEDYFSIHKRPVPAHIILRILSKKVQAQHTTAVINSMLDSNMIQAVLIDGVRHFRPPAV